MIVTLVNKNIRPGGTVAVRLPAAARTLDWTVYDARGQEVFTSRETDIAQGLHYWTWDGRNNQDERVGLGLYFVRVTADLINGGTVEMGIRNPGVSQVIVTWTETPTQTPSPPKPPGEGRNLFDWKWLLVVILFLLGGKLS